MKLKLGPIVEFNLAAGVPCGYVAHFTAAAFLVGNPSLTGLLNLAGAFAFGYLILILPYVFPLILVVSVIEWVYFKRFRLSGHGKIWTQSYWATFSRIAAIWLFVALVFHAGFLVFLLSTDEKPITGQNVKASFDHFTYYFPWSVLAVIPLALLSAKRIRDNRLPFNLPERS